MKKNIRFLLPAIAVVGSLMLGTMMPVLNTYADVVTDCQNAPTICALVTNTQEFKDALANSSIEKVVLGTDISMDEIVVVNRAFTIDGNGHGIISTAARGIQINTKEAVVITNLKLTTTTPKAYGFHINNTAGYNVTINNVITTTDGTALRHDNSGAIKGSLSVNDSVFQWAKASGAPVNYDTELVDRNVVGILSLGHKDSSWAFSNTTIQGYMYGIIADGGDAAGGNIDFIDGTIKGWASFVSRNASGTQTNPFSVYISGSHLHGINIFTGNDNSYGNVVIESSAHNDIIIVNTDFTVYENDAALNNGANSEQYAVLNAQTGAGNTNSISLSGCTYVVPDEYMQKKTQTAPFQFGDTVGTGITVIGGQYSYNPEAYLDQSFPLLAARNDQNLWQVVSTDNSIPLYIGDTNELDTDANGDLRIYPKETWFSGGTFGAVTIKLGTPVLADRVSPIYFDTYDQVFIDYLLQYNPNYQDIFAAFEVTVLNDAGGEVRVKNNNIVISVEITEEQYNKLKAFGRTVVYYPDPASGLFTETLDATLDSYFDNTLGQNIYTVTFNTKHLSAYAIGGAAASANPVNPGATSPNTGAGKIAGLSVTAATLVASILVGLATSVATFVTLRRKH